MLLSFGTSLERIAAESVTPPRVLFRSRNMSRDLCLIALDGVLRRRTSDVSRASSLKLGTAWSRIRIGEESNGFTARTSSTHFLENNPMHIRMGNRGDGW